MTKLLKGVVLLVVFTTFRVVVGSETAVVDFESQIVGTVFGGPGGEAPGDVIFTEDGIDVSVETDLSGSFGQMTIDGSFPTATMSNINLKFDFANLPFVVRRVTFDYVDFGGVKNVGINGYLRELPSLTSAPRAWGGAGFRAYSNGGGRGTVLIAGKIGSVTVGGQEFGMDNFVAMKLPEPSGISLLLAPMFAVLLRRNRCLR